MSPRARKGREPVTVSRRLYLPVGAPQEKRDNTLRWLRELAMQAAADQVGVAPAVTYTLRLEQRAEEKSTGWLLEVVAQLGVPA